MRSGFTSDPEVADVFRYMTMASHFNMTPDEVDRTDGVLVEKMVMAVTEAERKHGN